MEIAKLKLSKIKPYAKNPRKNDGAVDAVAESIRQCGYCAPIVVDEDYVILAGHTRYKALKKLGWAEAEVVVRAGLTDEQKRKYRLLDNKTNEFAGWDFELLESELEGLDFEGFDFGFDIPLIDEPVEAVDDDYDVVLPDEAKTKPGDVWQLGRHRLICGDATDINDIEKLMDGHKADLFLTDPPYNVAYEGKTKDKLKITNDSMEDTAFREFLASAFETAKQNMKAGASFYIWHADSEGYNFRGAIHDVGMTVRQCLIWVKNVMVMGRQDYQWKRDDIVLDTFAGSGTTIIACEQLGRSGYCSELDPKYCDVIINRWENFTGQKAVLLNA